MITTYFLELCLSLIYVFLESSLLFFHKVYEIVLSDVPLNACMQDFGRKV